MRTLVVVVPAHGLPVVEVGMDTVSKDSTGTQEVVHQGRVVRQVVLQGSAMTVRIVGSSRTSRRSWVWKLWRSSKRVVKGIKVIGRCGCMSRESTWAPWWGSRRWQRFDIVVVVSVVVGVSGRWFAMGKSRSPCGRRFIVGCIFVQWRVPSSKGSPIDNAFPLDLIDRIRGDLGFFILWVLCVIVSIAPE